MGPTDIAGILVGHWSDAEAGTGCTVVLCPDGAVGGVDVRGTAPGTRETALLDPVCMVEEVHAVLLSGGSAFGLAAADGVMRWLAERGRGFDAGVARVPIVPAAILFDLGIGRPDRFPDTDAGYAACQSAGEETQAVGNVGAGCGATAGKILGMSRAMKTGLGMATMALQGVKVAALVVANPLGHIVDPERNRILAGPRSADGQGFVDTVVELGRRAGHPGANTTLGVVVTDVRLTKAGATKIAQMAHDGLARTIRPVHTHEDGDTIFALSCGEAEADLSLVGSLAADAVAAAVLNAAYSAEAAHGLPSARDLMP